MVWVSFFFLSLYWCLRAHAYPAWSGRIPPCDECSIARKGISIVNHWPTDSIDRLIDWLIHSKRFYLIHKSESDERKIKIEFFFSHNKKKYKKKTLTWHSAGHRAVCCEQHSLSLSFGSANRLRGSFKRAIARDVCKSVFTSSWVVFRLFAKKLPRYPVCIRVCVFLPSPTSLSPPHIDQAILFGSNLSVWISFRRNSIVIQKKSKRKEKEQTNKKWETLQIEIGTNLKCVQCIPALQFNKERRKKLCSMKVINV